MTDTCSLEVIDPTTAGVVLTGSIVYGVLTDDSFGWKRIAGRVIVATSCVGAIVSTFVHGSGSESCAGIYLSYALVYTPILGVLSSVFR